jgi:5'-phosphate synthase pdxT subunit
LLVGVLALQGDYREHIATLKSLGADAIPVRTEADLAKVSGLVVPGGESTAMSNLAKTFGLFPALRDFAKSKPVLGTCAGLIMLADQVEGAIEGQEFIGGLDIKVSRNAYGGQTHSFEAEVDFGGSKERVAFIRAPRILAVGNAEVLASLNGETVAVQQGNLIGASFHPEITSGVLLHKRFLDLVNKE